MQYPASIAASIAERHMGVWGAKKITSAILHDLITTRVYHNASGNERYGYLSRKSWLVVSQDDAQVFFRRCYPPLGERVLDATMDHQDVSYLLTSTGKVHRYATPGPGGVSDWPDATISVKDYMSAGFKRLLVTDVVGDYRILMLWGSDGALMLQVSEESFQVLEALRIDLDSGMLVGSADIVFVRMSEVFSLKSGQVLLGTRMADGTTTEILIELASRSPVGVWDKGVKLSRTVTTGELLTVVENSMMGRPTPPEWLPTEDAGSDVSTLRWSQKRPDLVVGYEVWLGIDSATPSLYLVTHSGSIRHCSLKTEIGHVYHVTLRAMGTSHMSDFSEELVLEPMDPNIPRILKPYEFNAQENADFQGQLIGSLPGTWSWNVPYPNPESDMDWQINWLITDHALALDPVTGCITATNLPSIGDVRNLSDLPLQVTLTSSKGSDTKLIILHLATHPGS